MKDFRMGIVWADNNSRKMQGKPMLRIIHYNKAWWRRVGREILKFAEEHCDSFTRSHDVSIDELRQILGRNESEEPNDRKINL